MITEAANLLVVVSEVVLSAYPLLIKLVDASIFFQTGLRMFIFAILAALGASLTGSPLMLDTLLSGETLATGILNLTHVLASYVGFERLPAGNAMAIFYTYPLFNLIGTTFLLGESLPVEKLPWIGLALAGAVALAKPTTTNWSLLGVLGALLAALTETGIYLWFKASHTVKIESQTGKEEETQEGPWRKMFQMYGASGLLWLVVGIALLAVGMIDSSTFRLSAGGLGSIVLFNSFVGFLGYALRFYMVPQVSTVVFSALSFLGVVSAYVFGWLGASEIPTLVQVGGAAAIIVANAFLVTAENV